MSANESGLSFVWKIANFSMLPHQLNEVLESPKFVVDTWENVDFYLLLYPRGEDGADEGHLSLYLCRVLKDPELKINFTFTVESIEHSEEIQGTIKDHVFENSWGFAQFVSLADIYAKRKQYLPQDTLTIRCEISSAEEISTELVVNQKSKSTFTVFKKHCVSRTCVLVQRRSMMWSIRKVNESLEPTSILLASALKNSPSLKLILNLNKIASGDGILIFIQQTSLSSEAERLFVKCKITVTSTHEEYQTSKTSSHLFELNIFDVWTFPLLITTNMLTDEKYLNVDDTLLLRCEFAFSYMDGIHHLENNYLPCTFETRPKNSELRTCFKSLYGSGKFCDIELMAGGRTFPYYKLILCARSSVFSAMFENDMKEKASNVVEIDDVDPDTLQRMLTYMHSEDLPEDLSHEDACELYQVADKYDASALKKRCSVLLASDVSLLNVCELLVLADALLDSFLMTAVLDFICCHTAQVFHSAQWEIFMEDNPKLSCEVMHKMLTGKCQF